MAPICILIVPTSVTSCSTSFVPPPVFTATLAESSNCVPAVLPGISTTNSLLFTSFIVITVPFADITALSSNPTRLPLASFVISTTASLPCETIPPSLAASPIPNKFAKSLLSQVSVSDWSLPYSFDINTRLFPDTTVCGKYPAYSVPFAAVSFVKPVKPSTTKAFPPDLLAADTILSIMSSNVSPSDISMP